MRYLSLCSGIEAATVAWHPMGWEPAAFAEIESFPAAVLRHHYPNTPNLGDMTKWREWNVGAIDLLVGGTPCQSFSVAGLRKGLSDPRGGLMLTFLEIAQSLRPRWVVWENVPGVLSSGSGRDFGSFLGALGDLGYGWAYRVLDAQWCRVDGYERAVPQRRRRVFVVGCFADATRAAQVLFERQSVERNPAARGKARQGAASDADGGVESGGCYWDGSDCAATLTKQNAGGGQRMPDKANFGAVLQPAVTCFAGSSFARYDESRSASTIRRDGGDLGGGSETFVAVPFRKSHRASSATDDESWVRAETANTLNSFDTGERDTHAVAIDLYNQAIDGTGRGVPLTVAFHPTQDPISSTDGTSHAMGCGSKQGTATVAVAVAPSRRPQSADVTQQIAAVHQATMVVRRLTPVECERLQGFPDGYTDIPWRGKAESPDGPRYKALGNSMAVNCMRWIGRRIDAVEKGTELPA